MKYKDLFVALFNAKSRSDANGKNVKVEAAKSIGTTVAISYVGWPVIITVAASVLLIMAFVVIMCAVIAGNSKGVSGASISYLNNIYEECESITVKDRDGNIIGTYSLEEYVAGVVEAEGYTGEGIEALKAQAVAARTYAIYKTSTCSSPITASQGVQEFEKNPDLITANAKEAVAATEGEVLTYNGEIFMSEYDSLCYNDSRCPDAVKTKTGDSYTLTVTYTKQPNNETHKITLSDSFYDGWIVEGYGHARGMSQLVSYQMAKEGMTYDEILKYFYSDGVEISKLTSSNNEGFLHGVDAVYPIRNTTPTSSDKYFNEPYLGSHNRGQCVWYVRGRGMEIIATADGIDEEKRETALNAVKNTSGHGRQWWNNPGLVMFNSSNDYTKPKTGSIIVWKYTDSYASTKPDNYGHVAIIEEVNEENQTVTITEGWTNTGSCSSNWSCINFNYKTLSMSDFYNWAQHYNNSSRYIFLGYVYLLD